MSNWKFCGIENPPQGLKVLCMHKGDLYVAQRFGKYWFSIPFYSCEFSRYFEPDMWQYIDFPESLTGLMKVKVEGEEALFTIDELQKKYPTEYIAIVQSFKKSFDKKKRPNLNVRRIK